MKPVVVFQVLHWLRRKHPDFHDMSLFALFAAAYFKQFGATDKLRVLQDMGLFAKTGQVPFYLQRFIRRELYPLFVHKGEVPLLTKEVS